MAKFTLPRNEMPARKTRIETSTDQPTNHSAAMPDNATLRRCARPPVARGALVGGLRRIRWITRSSDERRRICRRMLRAGRNGTAPRASCPLCFCAKALKNSLVFGPFFRPRNEPQKSDARLSGVTFLRLVSGPETGPDFGATRRGSRLQGGFPRRAAGASVGGVGGDMLVARPVGRLRRAPR